MPNNPNSSMVNHGNGGFNLTTPPFGVNPIWRFGWFSRILPTIFDQTMSHAEQLLAINRRLDDLLRELKFSYPVLIDVSETHTNESVLVQGVVWLDYVRTPFSREFNTQGLADGCYYVNIINCHDVQACCNAGGNWIGLSNQFMPDNNTTLYTIKISGGKIVDVQFNDLYTGMHNADPNAHGALFDAIRADMQVFLDDYATFLAEYQMFKDELAQWQADHLDDAAALQAQITANTNAVAAIESTITVMQGSITTLQTDVGTIQTTIATMQTNISTNATNISNVREDLTTEIANRTSADTALQTQITANSNTIVQLQAADTVLQGKIDNEATLRAQGDAQLQTNVTTEQTARIAGDALLQQQITAMQATHDSINSTITTLSSSVGNLQGRMTDAESEIASLWEQYTALDNRVDNFENYEPRISNLENRTNDNETNISNLQVQVSNNTNDITDLKNIELFIDGCRFESSGINVSSGSVPYNAFVAFVSIPKRHAPKMQLNPLVPPVSAIPFESSLNVGSIALMERAIFAMMATTLPTFAMNDGEVIYDNPESIWYNSHSSYLVYKNGEYIIHDGNDKQWVVENADFAIPVWNPVISDLIDDGTDNSIMQYKYVAGWDNDNIYFAFPLWSSGVGYAERGVIYSLYKSFFEEKGINQLVAFMSTDYISEPIPITYDMAYIYKMSAGTPLQHGLGLVSLLNICYPKNDMTVIEKALFDGSFGTWCAPYMQWNQFDNINRLYERNTL